MHGFGKLITHNGLITYTGQFRNDFKWGQGKLVDSMNNLEYEGSWI